MLAPCSTLPAKYLPVFSTKRHEEAGGSNRGIPVSHRNPSRTTFERFRRHPVVTPALGIDRIIVDLRHGRFERLLSATTAIGAVVTTAEIFFEHDSASFGNKWMWAPIVIGPIGALAGLAGFASHRAAKTILPAASAIIILNGLQGTFLHARGIHQKPGGFKNFRYNMEQGPPLMAPLLVTLVGGMGLIAAILRREP